MGISRFVWETRAGVGKDGKHRALACVRKKKTLSSESDVHVNL